MRDDSWKEEMDALVAWTEANWEKTGKRHLAAGVTGSLDLGPTHVENPDEKRKVA